MRNLIVFQKKLEKLNCWLDVKFQGNLQVINSEISEKKSDDKISISIEEKSDDKQFLSEIEKIEKEIEKGQKQIEQWKKEEGMKRKADFCCAACFGTILFSIIELAENNVLWYEIFFHVFSRSIIISFMNLIFEAMDRNNTLAEAEKKLFILKLYLLIKEILLKLTKGEELSEKNLASLKKQFGGCQTYLYELLSENWETCKAEQLLLDDFFKECIEEREAQQANLQYSDLETGDGEEAEGNLNIIRYQIR